MKWSLKRSIALCLVLLMTVILLVSCAGENPKSVTDSDKKPDYPTQEEILAALSQASKEAIDRYYAEYKQNSGCGYFFDEDCTSKILNEVADDTIEPHTYTVTVESKRTWKNVDVTETEEVHLTYNAGTNLWEFMDYVILELKAEWHIDGEYQTESGVTIGVRTGEYLGGGSDVNTNAFGYVFANCTKAIFSLTTEKGRVHTDELVKLYTPCSKGIQAGGASFSTDGTQPEEPVEANVTVYPDQITYMDHTLEFYKKEILS